MNAYVGIAEWFEAVLRDSDGLVVPDLEPADVTVTVQLADDASFTLDDLTTTPPATWKERLPGLYGFLYAPLKAGDFTYRVELNSDPTIAYDGLIEVLPAPAAGTGDTQQSFTSKTSSGVGIDSVKVWITNDAEGANVVAGPQYSNSQGVTNWMLSSGTYYVWQQKAGYTFTMPEVETVL
jgi:hypothetical protein